MPRTIFVQIHALTDYTAVLLNADESGLSKTLPYGGTIRIRISSQCLKRHWRKHKGRYSLMDIAPDPVRTKELAELGILQAVKDRNPDLNLSDDARTEVIKALNNGLYGKEGNNQVMLFGNVEVEYLAGRVAEALKGQPDAAEAGRLVGAIFDRSSADNFHAFRNAAVMPAGVIGAAWGRVDTADHDANIRGAVSVSHAITTHAEEKEPDFFTTMDDLNRNQGAGYLGYGNEINSGIYYVYVCVEVPALVARTTPTDAENWMDADRTVTAEISARLAGLVATVSPGARSSGTAPMSYAGGLLVEIGERQPRKLTSAFRQATEPQMEDAKAKLTQAVGECDRRYGEHESRRWLGFGPEGHEENSLDEIVDWIRQSVLDGEAA